MNKKKDEAIFDEVKSILEDGQEELVITKSPLIDEKNGQVSLKLPISFALKSEIDKKSEFVFAFNPKKEETLNEIKKSKLVIYLKP